MNLYGDGESGNESQPDAFESLRVFSIYGIGAPLASYAFDKTTKMALENPYKDITVLIHSFGGDAYEAIAVVDALLTAKGMLKGDAKLRGVVHGYAMSAATYILQHMDVREATAHSIIMVHGMHGGMEGSTSKMAQVQKVGKMLTDIYRDAYLSRGLGKKSRTQWNKLLSEDTGEYLTATQALDWGLIDRIVPIGESAVVHPRAW